MLGFILKRRFKQKKRFVEDVSLFNVAFTCDMWDLFD